MYERMIDVKRAEQEAIYFLRAEKMLEALLAPFTWSELYQPSRLISIPFY
jgi:hypothetical protein